MTVRVTDLAGLDLGFRREGGLRAIFQRGERLIVAIEIDGGNGVGGGVSAAAALSLLSMVWT